MNYELSLVMHDDPEPEIITFYFTPAGDTINDIREAAISAAAHNKGGVVNVYVMPDDTAWVFDSMWSSDSHGIVSGTDSGGNPIERTQHA
jgi:hypothetical protein